jgi:hypothetical protein
MNGQRSAARSFQDLLLWQKAHKLVLAIYKLTAGFPKHEIYGLTIQMRRAAVSVPANIAEGFRRRGKVDKVRFLNIAEGIAGGDALFFDPGESIWSTETPRRCSRPPKRSVACSRRTAQQFWKQETEVKTGELLTAFIIPEYREGCTQVCRHRAVADGGQKRSAACSPRRAQQF